MTGQNKYTEHSLWSFTLDCYPKPGVQGAVIALQDNQGADVNFLFYCAWCAATGRSRLDAVMFDRVEALVALWRDQITKPLRRLRDRIKTEPALAALEGAMDVRGKILAAEIDSERVAQIIIDSSAGSASIAADESSAAIAESNLRAYLAYIDADVDDVAEENLQTLLRAIF